MIVLIFLIFALILYISFFPIKVRRIEDIILITLGIILIFVAGLRADDVTNDYNVYLKFWQQRNLKGDVEFSFVWIKDFLKNYLHLPPQYLFLTFAALGVSSKFIAIRKLAAYPFLALLVYLSHYYILHELTQIRIGVASGFFLLAIYFKIKNNIKLTILFLCLSVVFHYSAAVGFIILFLNDKKRVFYLMLIPIGYLLYFLNNQLSITIPIPYIQEKMEIYDEMKKYGVGDEINVFNFVFLSRILILYFLFYKAKVIAEFIPHIYVFLKIYTISIFSFLLLSGNAVYSFRIQEFFGIIEIVLIPTIVFAYKKKIMGKLLVIGIAFSFILIDIYYNEFIFK